MVNVEELYLMWLMEVFNIDIENPKKECKTHGPAECSLEEDQEKNFNHLLKRQKLNLFDSKSYQQKLLN